MYLLAAEEHREIKLQSRIYFISSYSFWCYHLSFPVLLHFSVFQVSFHFYFISVYEKSLGDDISSETSGDFRKALLILANVRIYFLLHHPQYITCSVIIFREFKTSEISVFLVKRFGHSTFTLPLSPVISSQNYKCIHD